LYRASADGFFAKSGVILVKGDRDPIEAQNKKVAGISVAT